jgi:hypothetical protein
MAAMLRQEIGGGKRRPGRGEEGMTMSRGEMPETNKVALVDWNRVTHVVIAGATRRAESSRDPTCVESIIATALANAVAVASAACCRGADREPELAEVDLQTVIALVAERTVATVLDDAILLLREVLTRCIERGDASVYAVGEDEEGDEAVRFSLGNTRRGSAAFGSRRPPLVR